MRAGIGIAVVVLAGLTGGAPAQPAKGPGGKVKGGGLMLARFVKEAHGAVVVAHPAKLTKAAAAAGVPLDPAWKLLKDEIGIDAKTVSRVEVLVTPFPHSKSLIDPTYGVRFTGPTADRVARAVLAIPADKKGMAIIGAPWYESPRFRLGADDYWNAFVPDPATAVFAPRHLFPDAAIPTDKVPPLAQAAETTDLTAHDATVVAVPAVFLSRIDRYLIGQKNESVEALRPLLAKVKTVVATLDLGRDPVIRAEFRTDGPKTAAAVAGLLRENLAVLKKIGVEKALAGANLAPELAPLVRALGGAAIETAAVAVDGGTAVVTVPRPAAFGAKKD